MEKIGGSKLYKMNKTKPIPDAAMHKLHEEKKDKTRQESNKTRHPKIDTVGRIPVK